MESKPIRMVNVVPVAKLKKLPVLEDDDDCVSCGICSKTFAHEVALKNHARIEHFDAVLSGQDLCVRKPPKSNNKIKFTEEQKKEVKKKTEELVSSMKPTNIMTMASPDNEDDSDNKGSSDGESKVKRRRSERAVKDPPKKESSKRKIEDSRPITGPFECLQPSNITNGTCHQMFFSCCEYSIHFRDEHTRRRKGIKCQVCEKPLRGAGEENYPYSCQFCGAGFEHITDLSDHTSKTHIKLKPFQCSICNKRFTQQGGLQQHMRVHTGDRPFACTHCPKAFTQKSGLDQHLRIHTKYKPYKCVICGKAFCQSVHLQQHMRTHTNVAPFQCIICQKRFKQSNHLNYHLKYHNPLNMTDEQKIKYVELMRMMGKEGVFDFIDNKSGENGDVLVQNGQKLGDNGQGLDDNGQGLDDNGQGSDDNRQGSDDNVQVVLENCEVLMENEVELKSEEMVDQEDVLDSEIGCVYLVPEDWPQD